MNFEDVCRKVEAELENRWKSADETDRMMRLEKEKKAIMGFEEEVAEYRQLIGQIIKDEGLGDAEYPQWYRSLVEGVFNEIYGLAGLAPWAYDETEEYRKPLGYTLSGYDGDYFYQSSPHIDTRRVKKGVSFKLSPEV